MFRWLGGGGGDVVRFRSSPWAVYVSGWCKLNISWLVTCLISLRSQLCYKLSVRNSGPAAKIVPMVPLVGTFPHLLSPFTLQLLTQATSCQVPFLEVTNYCWHPGLTARPAFRNLFLNRLQFRDVPCSRALSCVALLRSATMSSTGGFVILLSYRFRAFWMRFTALVEVKYQRLS